MRFQAFLASFWQPVSAAMALASAQVPGADMISGGEPLVNPKPYHPDRFEKSSWGKVADF